MTFIVWLLSAVLVLTCVLLTFLVLIQLPKKDAGAGVAFGAGATDALFGAGSGNALTKLTRHATVAFLVLSLLLTILVTRKYRPSHAGFGANVDKAAAAAAAAQPAPPLTNAGAMPGTSGSQAPAPTNN